jgi:hypothetical protein
MREEEEEDEEEVESIMLDPTHQWWNLWALFRRVFRSHRFKVTRLYHGYSLKVGCGFGFCGFYFI